MQQQCADSANQQINKLLNSKKETAQILNVSLRTIDNLIASKELAVRRIGRRVLIPTSAIQNFIRSDHRIPKAA